MSLKVAIEGVGVVGGFGCGIADLNRALELGSCTPDQVSVNTKTGQLDMPVFRANTSALVDYVPKRVLRRIDHYSRMAILGAYLALDDAGQIDMDKENLGVVIASGYGASRTMFEFMDSVIDDGDPLASPTKFSNSVHNAAAAHVSILLKAKGPTLTVSQFELSIPSALISACQWLEQKRVDRVLFGGIDEYCDVLGYCRGEFFGHGHGDIVKPLKFGDHTAIAGEGAALFLLSHQMEDNDSYGYIRDVKLGNLRESQPNLPKGSRIIIGADGHIQCGRRYEEFMTNESSIKAYSTLYGTMPTGMGFDMAVAAISNKSNRIFSKPESNQLHKLKKGSDRDLARRPICCLKLGLNGEYGLITIGR